MRKLGNPRKRFAWAEKTVNTLQKHCARQNTDGIQTSLMELVQAAATYPDDDDLGASMARALALSVEYFSDQEQWKEMTFCYDQLKRVASGHHSDLRFQVPMAIGAQRATIAYVRARHWNEVEPFYADMMACPEGLQDEAGIGEDIANAVGFTMGGYVDAERVDDVARLLPDLERQIERFPGAERHRDLLDIVESTYPGLKAESAADDEPTAKDHTEEDSTEARSEPEDIRALRQWASDAVNEILALGDNEKWLKMFALYEEFKDRTAAHPDNPDIQYVFIKGAVNAANRAGFAESWRRQKTIYEDISAVAERFPDDLQIQRAFAMGAATVLYDIGSLSDWEAMDERFDEISRVVERFPDDEELNLSLATACHAAIHHGSRTEDMAYVARLEAILRSVFDAYPENQEIQIQTAEGLFFAVVAYAGSKDWARLKSAYDLFMKVSPDVANHNDIQEYMSQAIVYIAACYLEADRRADIRYILDDLLDLHEAGIEEENVGKIIYTITERYPDIADD